MGQRNFQAVNTSAIMRMSKRVLQEKKHTKFSEKRLFLHFLAHIPTRICVSGAKKCSFFRKFGVLCFLVTPVLRFTLFPYYQKKYIESWRYILKKKLQNSLGKRILIFSEFKLINFLSPWNHKKTVGFLITSDGVQKV